MIYDRTFRIHGRTASQFVRGVGHTRLGKLARSPGVRLVEDTDIHYRHDAQPRAAANPAIALGSQSPRLVSAVAEVGAVGRFTHE